MSATTCPTCEQARPCECPERNPVEDARFEREVRDLFSSYQRASGDFYRAPCDVWGFTFHALESEDVPSDVSASIAAAASRAAEAEYRRWRSN